MKTPEMVSELAKAQQNALFNNSVQKGIAVLNAFDAKRPSMSLAEVAEAAEISKSSAQRFVFTLEAMGYLKKNARTRRYQLTPLVVQLGYHYLAADTLIDVASPYLSELSNVTGETTTMSEPYGTEMVYVARFVCTKFIPINLPVGSKIPMYCTGGGRAYLGALPSGEARALLESSDIVRHTPNTVTSVDEIELMLAEGRRRGYHINREELFIGDMTIAAAILDGDRRPVASVHVTAPSSRWTLADAEQRLSPAVIDCALGISNSIRTLSGSR